MNLENLYTAGGEFKLPNGKFYKGRYHIHQGMGAMVGAKHTQGQHDMLTPATKRAKDKVENIESQRRSLSRTQSIPPPSVPQPRQPRPRTASTRSTRPPQY